MRIVIRDSMGMLAIMADSQYGVSFLGDRAYFTSVDGEDYNVSIRNLVSIEVKE